MALAMVEPAKWQPPYGSGSLAYPPKLLCLSLSFLPNQAPQLRHKNPPPNCCVKLESLAGGWGPARAS